MNACFEILHVIEVFPRSRSEAEPLFEPVMAAARFAALEPARRPSLRVILRKRTIPAQASGDSGSIDRARLNRSSASANRPRSALASARTINAAADCGSISSALPPVGCASSVRPRSL